MSTRGIATKLSDWAEKHEIEPGAAISLARLVLDAYEAGYEASSNRAVIERMAEQVAAAAELEKKEEKKKVKRCGQCFWVLPGHSPSCGGDLGVKVKSDEI